MPPHIPNRRVGKTQLEVPRMGLGTGPLTRYGTDEAIRIVQRALEVGVNFIDTAPLYGSETCVGLALQGLPRDSYILATKVGRIPQDGGGFRFDFSRDGVLRSIENSLKALQLDRIDILHIHDADDHYEQALNEAFPTLAELRGQGVIQAVGAGMNQWQMQMEFAKHADFDCFLLAGRYTLLEQTALEALQFFKDNDIGVFAAGIYNSGILATGATENATYNYHLAPPEIKDKARRLEGIAARYKVPLNAAAVQFVWAHPAYTSLLIGADRVGQVSENINTLAVKIPDAFWQEAVAEGLIPADAPLPNNQ